MALLGLNASAVRREIGHMARAPGRKPLPRVVREVAAWRRRGLPPREYFEQGLYLRLAGDPAHHLAESQWRAFMNAWEAPEAHATLSNKLALQRALEAAPGVRMPSLVGTIEGGVWRPEGEGEAPLAGPDDLAEALDRVVRDRERPLFAKPVDQWQGVGVRRIGEGADVRGLWADASRRTYIVQEAVRQHPALARLYPHALNTLRVLTCQPGDGDARVLAVFLRVGAGGRAVDNDDGLFVAVDAASGRLVGPLRRMPKSGGGSFARHPDTGVSADGLAVPDFEAVGPLVAAASAAVPYPVVGWDVGFAEDGPVLIEGNHWPGVHKTQLLLGGLMANEAFLSFIDEFAPARAVADRLGLLAASGTVESASVAPTPSAAHQPARSQSG